MCIRKYFAISLTILTSILLTVGCGDNNDPITNPVPDYLASETIGTDGGELDGGTLVLTIPNGALTSDTKLTIDNVTGNNPLGGSGPIYRLSGLPEALHSSATLRILNRSASLKTPTMLFIGEERESLHGGQTETWFRIASRDSAGWCLAQLDRGAYVLGDKDSPDLKITTSNDLSVATNEAPGHFEVIYDSNVTSVDFAEDLLAKFDLAFDALASEGFEMGFGDKDSYWPLSVHIRTPEFSEYSEYITAPWARGHFNFDPELELAGENIIHFVLHELFHCAQSYFDDRHPSEWKTVNEEMRWMDEATAAFLEASIDPLWIPVGLNLDNYLAPMGGIGGHQTLGNSAYGYGMCSFMQYFIEHQGEDKLLALYEAFPDRGTAVSALMAVMDPPLDEWCTDLQKQVALHGLYDYDMVGYTWFTWPFATTLFDVATGTSNTKVLHVPDFGSDVWKGNITGDTASQNSDLQVSLLNNTAYLDLVLYGRNADQLPVLLAEGTNEILYDDWPSISQNYQELVVQVINPHGTGPKYNTITDAEIQVSVIAEEEGVPAFKQGRFSMKYVAHLGDGTIVPQDVLAMQYAAGSTAGNNFSAVWDTINSQDIQLSGTLNVNMANNPLRIIDWSYQWRWTYTDPKYYKLYEVSGGELPLYTQGESYTTFRLDDNAVCESLTNVYFIEVMNDVIQTELDQWYCDPNSYLTVYLKTSEQ